jgi:hypothetical protein
LLIIIIIGLLAYKWGKSLGEKMLPPQPTPVVNKVTHNRPENWKRQQRAVVPPVAVPLDATPTSTNSNGPVRVQFAPKMEIK